MESDPVEAPSGVAFGVVGVVRAAVSSGASGETAPSTVMYPRSMSLVTSPHVPPMASIWPTVVAALYAS